ncbi:MAG: Fic family protein [Bacteroidota bacterium]
MPDPNRRNTNQLQLLTPRLYSFYKKKQKLTLRKHFDRIKQQTLSLDSFNFYLVSSAIYSSLIEGVNVDFNSYLRYLNTPGVKGSKDLKQVQDLVAAYEFAQKRALNQKNMLLAHEILTNQLLTRKYRGKLRDREVHVYNLETGQIIYTGADTKQVQFELDKLFADIAILRKRELTIDQAFYYAAFIHLVFAKIHPFADGNGLTARLLEKWFLANKLGKQAWYIQSERNYQRKLVSYYRNIDIGKNYQKNDYDLALDFLLMLPWALRLKPLQ